MATKTLWSKIYAVIRRPIRISSRASYMFVDALHVKLLLWYFAWADQREKLCFVFHIAQLRCEECYMKIHTALEVNIAQLEEVTQLTVNRILESALALAMATRMTCCSARRTTEPTSECRERGRSDFVTGPSEECQHLSLKSPKIKEGAAAACRVQASNCFAVPADGAIS